MDTGIAFISGMVLGVFIFYMVLQKAVLIRLTSEDYALKVPLFGILTKLTLMPYRGIFTGEFLEFQKRLKTLGKLIEPEKAFAMAQSYGIDYISTEGDRTDGTWSEGRYAFIQRSKSHLRPYKIHLNPNLDRRALSLKLSMETKGVISENEVYPFLFLHEIGHTEKAGNKNFLGLVITYTISGQRHSLEARKELFRQKREIEQRADRFALEALKRWRLD